MNQKEDIVNFGSVKIHKLSYNAEFESVDKFTYLGQELNFYNIQLICSLQHPLIQMRLKLSNDFLQKNSFIEWDYDTKYVLVGNESLVFTVNAGSYFLKFTNETVRNLFENLVNRLREKPLSVEEKKKSVFKQRTEDSSAVQYFQFYAYLSQQQNMLQDFVRTFTYQRAIMTNLEDFKNKVVLDVGAGSGILSFFAAQAGARKVYAIEASTMASNAEILIKANNLQHVIEVLNTTIEDIELPEPVDVIISEPIGYMLFNERMIESYLYGKKWLKPNGKMYPSRGDLHIAPFTDESLFIEHCTKANFWQQSYFHGVNLSALQEVAYSEYFRQPIVDTFDLRICLSKSIRYISNFMIQNETDLRNIEIPLEFDILESGVCHGLAFWFDVAFFGSSQTIWLSTAPQEPLTHWYQVRCLLPQSIVVKKGEKLCGFVQLSANRKQSYDILIELRLDGTNIISRNTLDLKNPFFRYNGNTSPPSSNVNVTSPSENYWHQIDNNIIKLGVVTNTPLIVNNMDLFTSDNKTLNTVVDNNIHQSDSTSIIIPDCDNKTYNFGSDTFLEIINTDPNQNEHEISSFTLNNKSVLTEIDPNDTLNFFPFKRD